MGTDGIAIAFVTPDQGELLTSIEIYINQQITEDKVEGFQAFVPKLAKEVVPEAPKPIVPVFGRRNRRYSNRV